MTDDQKNNISPQEDSQPVNQEPSQGMTQDIPPAVVETGEPALTPAPQEQPASEPSPVSAQETAAPAVVETGEPALTPAPQEQPASEPSPVSAQETAAPAVVETGEPALTPAPQEQPALEPSPASAQETAAPAVAENAEPAPGEEPQLVESPVPDVQDPEYPRQPVPPVQQPWPGYGPQAGAPQGPWAGYGPYGAIPPQAPPYGVPPQTPHQPMYGYPAPYPYGQPVSKPPRKKMSRGLKVFLWIASALVAGTVIGFSAFVISWAVAGPVTQNSVVETQPGTPEESQTPSQEEEGSQPSVKLPEVDVTPNEEGITINEKPNGDPLDAQQVYDRVVQSTVAITVSTDGETTSSSGTGIIATSDGYIITNAHVVLNSKSVLVTVTTYDGQQYDAVVVGMDRTTDLAIIKTNDYNFTPAEFGDADELEIGEWVLAIGNPGGERFASSLTRGIISGLDRAVERYSENGMTFIQTDAAINPGNSGGPLVNMYGQVVGINSSKIITDGYEGMGFAIPVSKAKDIIDQLLSGGYVEGRVRLGISGYDVSDTRAAFYGVPQGFMIASIDEDSSFAGTEAQVNDIITAIDGEPVQELTDISNLLLRYKPGDQVTVTLYRMPENGLGQGEEFDVTITLLEDKGETQK